MENSLNPNFVELKLDFQFTWMAEKVSSDARRERTPIAIDIVHTNDDWYELIMRQIT